MDIINKASEMLKDTNKRIIFTECLDETVLKAASILACNDICRPVFIGEPEKIVKAADLYNVSLEHISIININDEEKKGLIIDKYVHINPTYSENLLMKKMRNPLDYAEILVQIGYVDALIEFQIAPMFTVQRV